MPCVGRPAGTFGKAVTAAIPRCVVAGFVLRDAPDAPRGVVAAAVRTKRDAGPGAEHAQHRRAEIGGHANQRPDVGQLGFAMLGNRTAEIVIGGHGVNRYAGIRRTATQLVAARGRQVQRIAVRPLAVDLHAVVAELARAIDQLLRASARALDTRRRGK